jgi:nucleoside 2-deoxyribosyltransferase
MIYLASPYSHPHAMVRELRFHDACVALANLVRAGIPTFSPIVQGHPLALHGLPTDWAFWEAFDRDHISRCDELAVLTLDGWQDSVGVAAEIAIAAELGKPVWYLAPDATVSPTLARVATEGEP